MVDGAVSTRVVLVADRCTDSTVLRAQRVLDHDDLIVAVDAGTAGRARKVGTDVALVDEPVDARHRWLANTDADGAVTASWLATQLECAERGFIGVAGIVELDSASLPHDDLRAAFARAYRTHGDGTHPHVHGANLGCRADAYLAAGGWSSVATGEDHSLWHRLSDVGATTATTAVRVVTSARLQGRAPDGFASDLAALTVPA